MHLSQAEQDSDRTAQLESYGYRVLRVLNDEVEVDLEAVLEKIAAACGVTALRPDLTGEGQADERPPG
jgi:very-short-patch-repair endonuclease